MSLNFQESKLQPRPVHVKTYGNAIENAIL